MKSILITISSILFMSGAAFSQVKIGNNPGVIDPSALLELESTDKGLIIPRMTSIDRQNIPSPAEGLIVFDIWTQTLWYNSASGWIELVLTTVVYVNDQITDGDQDTWVVTQQNPDDDTVRIGTGGTERYRFTSRSLDQVNNGKSLFIGENAGKNDDLTDNENVFAGYKSGFTSLSGYSNTALGSHALFSNSNGNHNTAIGAYSQHSLNGGGFNSALGSYAMYNLQAGFWNTALGFEALYSNISGNMNAAVGYQSMRQITTSQNTAIGAWSLHNQSGGNNTAVGYYALFGNTGSGSSNVAVGHETLKSNTSGGYNVAIGADAMEFNTSGSTNVAGGWLALGLNQSGSNNTALGTTALYNNFTGSDNTAIGAGSGPDVGNPVQNYTTSLGRYALTTADNQVRIGHAGIGSIGGYQNWTNLSDGRFKKDIAEDVPGLDFITQLKPVTYHLDLDKINKHLGFPDSVMNDEAFASSARYKSNVVQTGFIAQEVELIAQSLGYDFSGVDAPKNSRDLYGLRYAEFVVPLVKAVQEQQLLIEKQMFAIEGLEFSVKSLQESIEALEKVKLP
jgi:trimeric autotransporter adhesin